MSFFRNIKLVILIGLVGCQIVVTAQTDTLTSGLIFDDAEYETVQRVDPNDGAKADLPGWVNLERFCPTVRNQGKISSCVGWSTGYGAMTIQRAILSNCTDKKMINQNAHSALFLFNQIKKGDCIRGARISDALEFLTQNGNCLAGHFDFDINDCGKQPNDKMRQLAKRFAINDYLALFGIKDNPRKKVFQVKKTLAQKRPVIIGMSVKRNFYELKDAAFWHPNIGNTAPAGGHAMVVVGYDDKREAFRLFNSWGKEWGDEGYIWVKYKDFGKYCKYGYVMYLVEKPLLKEKQIKLAANVLTSNRPRKNLVRKDLKKTSVRPKKSKQVKPRKRTSSQKKKSNPSVNTNRQNIDPDTGKGNIEPQAISHSTNPVIEKIQIDSQIVENQSIAVEVNAPPSNKNEPALEREKEEILSESEIKKQEEELEEILEIRSLTEFSGEFVFREFIGFNEETSQPQFDVADVKMEKDVYNTSRASWDIGQRFQILASTKSEEQYLYIFSIDAEKNVHFHWPRQEGLNEKFSGQNRTALLINNGSDVVIPGMNKVLKLAHPGTDRLVVLFSKKKIRGLKQLAEISVKKSGDFMTSFRHTLGDYAVPRSDIRYFPDRIGFEASTRGEGYIVPLVLEVTAK